MLSLNINETKFLCLYRIIIIIIIMEISTAPYLLNILRPKVRTKAIQATISSHRHRHIHTHKHTSSFKNYMPPKYTYQKAENQTTGASFALSLSLYLSFSPLAHAQVQVTCSPTEGKVG